jgi:site-specific DNA-methyltransferase (adenine-specific)
MLTEAASAGLYKAENFPEQYPRLQILTIAELLAGKQLRYPRLRDDTFKKAERQNKGETSQTGLFR